MAVAAYQFGDFRLDCGRFELLRNDRAIRLERKPMELLILLLASDGQLVTRTEIAGHLWSSEVFVDTEHGINTAIRKIRQVLGDDPENPLFVQTVTGKGYRFSAPVSQILPAARSPEPAVAASAPAESESSGTSDRDPRTKTIPRLWIWIGATSLALTLIAGVAGPVVWHRSTMPRIHSVTVLPLKNLSSDPNTEYFADGMTEELTTELSAIPELQVVSVSSVTPVKGSPESPAEVARKLGVDAVIEGSVSHSKDKVSIDMRLFDARSDRQLWAARFEDAPANLPALQKHIASEIASHARVLLTPSQQARLSSAKPLDPSAYDGYLQGRYLLSKRDFEGAVKMFRHAVVIDPGYARSWAGLAAGLADLSHARPLNMEKGSNPAQGPIREAKAAARHAIELDPENGEAWSALGQIAFDAEWDWKTAEYDLQRAIELSPSDSTTELRYATFLSIVGRRDEAVSHMRRALELDPLSFFNVRHMGSVLYWSRRYDESLEYIRKAEEMEPDRVWLTVDWEVDDYEMKGMGEQAVMADLRNFPLPDGRRWHDRLEAAYRSGGRKAYWETRIKFLQAIPDSPCLGKEIARIYVLSGENDKALENLNRSLNEGCTFFSMMRTEPLFDPLRGDPQFKDMLKKVNLSE